KGSIDISARRLGQKVEVVIKDYGKGISRANLPRIWDPFFTTKKPGEGTGLGLSLSYQIISGYGGDIIAASELKKWTEFTITLPATRGEA
ncbi:MAG: HAMP domain-containing histidine kinase, partial [Deltaproteobacteria bacterium]|nr:HAMP domain-containing histidine kinase [Deltaproteobacteria bacterium]